MSKMQGEAVRHSGDDISTGKSLPLFRPEALAAHEKFYGEVVLNRSLSSSALAWLAIGVAAAAGVVFFFGSYTETVSLHGIVLRPLAVDRSTLANPSLEVLATFGNSQGAILRPGMHFTLRCTTCPSPGPEIAVTVRRALSALSGASSRESVVTLSSREFASSLNKQWLRPGVEVELVILVGRRQLLPWLFQPSRERGNSQ